MKVIIDIPKPEFNHIKKVQSKRRGSIPYTNIAFGTPIPDNATNGDVIKAVFPGAVFTDSMVEGYVCSVECHLIGRDTKRMYFDVEWWNALYEQKEVEQ